MRAGWGRVGGAFAALLLAASALGSRAEPSAADAARSGIPDGYRRAQSFPVMKGGDGFEGTLELLQDLRFVEEVRREIDASLVACVRPPHKRSSVARVFCDSLEERPLQLARVRLLDARGREVASRTFERAFASLEPVALYGAKPRAFSVTVDYSVGFGSYAGPTTWFLDLRTGRLRWLTASGRDWLERDEMIVATTLKTAWRLVPARDGRSQDLLEIACRPDSGPDQDGISPFQMIYTRFHWTGKKWIRRQKRERRAFWENEGPEAFPPVKAFP